MKVHVLEANRGRGFVHTWEYFATRRFWFPVVAAARWLRELGVDVTFFSEMDPNIFDCDALLLSSRRHDEIRGTKFDTRARAASVDEIRSLFKGRLIWFDLRDSGGTAQFEVIGNVDLYAKQIIYKDLAQYRQNLKGGRLFTNYMADRLGVDNSLDPSIPVVDQQDDFSLLPLGSEDKLAVSWDISYDFRCITKAGLPRVVQAFEVLAARLNKLPHIDWAPATSARSIDVSAVFGLDQYPRRTIVHQRHLAIEKTRQRQDWSSISHDLAPGQYLKALRRSRVVLSCFGHGEVCFREHEAWIAGAAVAMPEMSAMRTFPERYLAWSTYAPLAWDLADLPEVVDRLLKDEDLRLSLARNGQDVMRQMYSTAGLERFAERFYALAQARDPDG